MSRSDFAHTQRYVGHCTRESRSELVRLGWLKLIERFAKDRDFPLHRAKPEIDNSPSANGPIRIHPRPCRGSKRAFLRRMEAGRL